jgi:predicted MFS family arabinose efflux permease
MAEVTAERPEAVSPASRGWAASTFDAFRFPDYRTIWFGSFIAFLAVNISQTAQGVVAYDLTGSNSAVGSVMLGQGIAMMFLNPFGGAISDRFPKRLLILFSQFVIGGVAFSVAMLITTGQISILFLAIGSFTMGSMFAILGPSRTALVGEVVSPERIGNAMALMQVGNNFGRIAGPFLAATFLVIAGAAGTYFIVAFMFVFVIVAYLGIPNGTPRARGQTSVFQDIRLGIGHVAANPRLTHSIVSFYLVTMLGMSNVVLMPGFTLGTLNAGKEGLGILLGAAAAGGFVMSLMVASLADSRSSAFILTLSSFTAGIGLILTGLAPSLPFAVLAMILVSGGTSVFQTLNNAAALRITKPMFFGRIISLMMVAWGMNNIVTLPIGFYGDWAGERIALATLGSMLSVVVLFLALWERRLTRRGL